MELFFLSQNKWAKIKPCIIKLKQATLKKMACWLLAGLSCKREQILVFCIFCKILDCIISTSLFIASCTHEACLTLFFVQACPLSLVSVQFSATLCLSYTQQYFGLGQVWYSPTQCVGNVLPVIRSNWLQKRLLIMIGNDQTWLDFKTLLGTFLMRSNSDCICMHETVLNCLTLLVSSSIIMYPKHFIPVRGFQLLNKPRYVAVQWKQLHFSYFINVNIFLFCHLRSSTVVSCVIILEATSNLCDLFIVFLFHFDSDSSPQRNELLPNRRNVMHMEILASAAFLLFILVGLLLPAVCFGCLQVFSFLCTTVDLGKFADVHVLEKCFLTWWDDILSFVYILLHVHSISFMILEWLVCIAASCLQNLVWWDFAHSCWTAFFHAVLWERHVVSVFTDKALLDSLVDILFLFLVFFFSDANQIFLFLYSFCCLGKKSCHLQKIQKWAFLLQLPPTTFIYQSEDWLQSRAMCGLRNGLSWGMSVIDKDYFALITTDGSTSAAPCDVSAQMCNTNQTSVKTTPGFYLFLARK